jgi:phage terminase large subunit
MLDLIKNLNPDRYKPIVFVVANTDTTSLERIQSYPHPLPIQKEDYFENKSGAESTGNEQRVYRIPRSREVGQSYMSSIFTTLYSFLFAFWLVGFQVRKDNERLLMHSCTRFKNLARNVIRSFRSPKISCPSLLPLGPYKATGYFGVLL